MNVVLFHLLPSVIKNAQGRRQVNYGEQDASRRF
jgi:hypothetical protein